MLSEQHYLKGCLVLGLRMVKPKLLLLAASLAASGCAGLQPVEVTGPRANTQPYPVMVTEDKQRSAAALVAASQLLGAGTAQVNLQPVTATIESLPQNQSVLYLPKVGAGPTMSEEELRESLRRFLRDWRNLIGASPAQLSLIERTDQPDGIRLAVYEQRPFRYPLRGQYGKLLLRFTSDRRLVSLSSSCLPDAERLQNSLTNLTPQITADDALKIAQGNGGLNTNQNANQPAPSGSPPPGSAQLVVYVIPSKGANALELHLAYEIQLLEPSARTVYVDVINRQIISAA